MLEYPFLFSYAFVEIAVEFECPEAIKIENSLNIFADFISSAKNIIIIFLDKQL